MNKLEAKVLHAQRAVVRAHMEVQLAKDVLAREKAILRGKHKELDALHLQFAEERKERLQKIWKNLEAEEERDAAHLQRIEKDLEA
jgi:hypothetical protein